MTQSDILLFGKTGRLGKAITEQFGARVISPSRKALDVSNFPALKTFLDVVLNDPEIGAIKYIINCTALNGLEACEQSQALAFAVNTQAPVTMAATAKNHDITFVHFSSDYAIVGDGKSPKPIPEGFPRWPCGVYGNSKLLGELAIEAVGGKSLIFRLSSIYSSDDMAGALDVVKQMRTGKGTAENPVKVLKQNTTMTSVRTIAKALGHVLGYYSGDGMEALLRSPTTLNLATSDSWSKLEFARAAGKAFCGDTPAVQEGTLPIPRPENSSLAVGRFETVFKYKLPTVAEDLAAEVEYWKVKQCAMQSGG